MIYYLCMSDNVNTMRKYLKVWGRALRAHVAIRCYEQGWRAEDFGPGACIFSDVDRMPAEMMPPAAALWEALEQRRQQEALPLRLLNRPGVTMGRVALLKRLRALGWNDFTVYQPDEPREEMRFPVFVRHAVEHLGAFSGLLHNEAELEKALAERTAAGWRREDLLIVEFLDTSDAGVFRKYSAMIVGEQIIPHHIFFQPDDWHVKRQAVSLSSVDAIEEERRYHAENPHHDALRERFTLAGVEYGRIDYAIRDGRIQVWEINPNPTLLIALRRYRAEQLPTRELFARRFNRAMLALDGMDEPRLERVGGRPPWWMRAQAKLQRAVHGMNM